MNFTISHVTLHRIVSHLIFEHSNIDMQTNVLVCRELYTCSKKISYDQNGVRIVHSGELYHFVYHRKMNNSNAFESIMFDKIRHKSIKIVAFFPMDLTRCFIYFSTFSVCFAAFASCVCAHQRLSGFRICNCSIKWFPEKKILSIPNIRLLCNVQCINPIYNVNIVCIFALQCGFSSDFRRQSYFFYSFLGVSF